MGAVKAPVGACRLGHSQGNFPVGGPEECAQVVPAARASCCFSSAACGMQGWSSQTL